MLAPLTLSGSVWSPLMGLVVQELPLALALIQERVWVEVRVRARAGPIATAIPTVYMADGAAAAPPAAPAPYTHLTLPTILTAFSTSDTRSLYSDK